MQVAKKFPKKGYAARRGGQNGKNVAAAAARTEERKERMMAALARHDGEVAAACRDADVHRSTHYNWLSTDPTYKALLEDLGNDRLDMVESALFKGAVDGCAKRQIFYLRTKGKQRGWVTSSEVTGGDGGPVQVDMDLSALARAHPPEHLTAALQDMLDKTKSLEETAARIKAAKEKPGHTAAKKVAKKTTVKRTDRKVGKKKIPKGRSR